jgi:outer membrane protein OmpA-like peptidoglycan-associated protein
MGYSCGQSQVQLIASSVTTEKNMKATMIVCLFVLMVSGVDAATLKLDKKDYSPGETIQITVSATGETKSGAWIGMIPSKVPHGTTEENDRNDLTYQYLGDKTSGVFEMAAPIEPGSYDIRLMEGEHTGDKEIASQTFRVAAVDYAAKLSLSKTNLLPGEKVDVTFSVSRALPKGAWLGIIPSDVPHGSEATNDQHDVNYQYIGDKTSATLTFQVPEKSGAYDFRLNDTDSNGHEIASVSFTIGEIKLDGKLTLKQNSFLPGEEIVVDFTASPTLPNSAWVGIIPSKVPHGKEEVNDQYDIQYAYLEKKASGQLKFTAPSEPGSYDLRMNSSDSNGVEITSVTFSVGGSLDAKGIARMIAEQGKVALYGVQFDFNKATLKPESSQVLDQVAEVMKQQPDTRFSLEGHTDNVGKADYNMDLSRKRAESVKTYLVQTRGVDAARLTTQGFGDTKPIAKNDTEAGRAQNRRVELVKK